MGERKASKPGWIRRSSAALGGQTGLPQIGALESSGKAGSLCAFKTNHCFAFALPNMENPRAGKGTECPTGLPEALPGRPCVPPQAWSPLRDTSEEPLLAWAPFYSLPLTLRKAKFHETRLSLPANSFAFLFCPKYFTSSSSLQHPDPSCSPGECNRYGQSGQI